MSRTRALRERLPRWLARDARFGDLRRLEPLNEHWGFDRGRPIDRFYIKRFLAEHATDVRGRVLEFADATYARRYGAERVASVDVMHRGGNNPAATIVGDLAAANEVPHAAFDCIIATQVLQYVADLEAGIATSFRALAPGGVLLATLPGITQIDQNDWDGPWLWSFTRVGARHLFGRHFAAEDLAIESHGNVLASIAFLHGMTAEQLAPHELEHRDERYPVLISVRASKPLSTRACGGKRQ